MILSYLSLKILFLFLHYKFTVHKYKCFVKINFPRKVKRQAKLAKKIPVFKPLEV